MSLTLLHSERPKLQSFGLSECNRVKNNLFWLRSLAPENSGFCGQGKSLENYIFHPGQGKVGEVCGWSGKFGNDLKNQGKGQGIIKVMTTAGNFVKGERMYFFAECPARCTSLFIRGYSFGKEFSSPVEQIHTFKNTPPPLQVIQFALLKLRVKLTFGSVRRYRKNVKCQGKIRECRMEKNVKSQGKK